MAPNRWVGLGLTIVGSLVGHILLGNPRSARRRRIRRRATDHVRVGDAKLHALLALCSTAGADDATVEAARERVMKGRVGRVLSHVVETVKAKRNLTFEPTPVELQSTMRMAAEVMHGLGMRPTHIAEWKMLVAIAVHTPTDEELDGLAAIHSETRAEQLAVAAEITNPLRRNLGNFLLGRISLQEWKGKPIGRPANWVNDYVDPDEPDRGNADVPAIGGQEAALPAV